VCSYIVTGVDGRGKRWARGKVNCMGADWLIKYLLGTRKYHFEGRCVLHFALVKLPDEGGGKSDRRTRRTGWGKEQYAARGPQSGSDGGSAGRLLRAPEVDPPIEHIWDGLGTVPCCR